MYLLSMFNKMGFVNIFIMIIMVSMLLSLTLPSSLAALLLEECSSDADCAAGLYCLSCPFEYQGSKCARSTFTDQFKLLNNSLPYNKYAFLTSHNSFAINGEPSHTGVPRLTFSNQQDTVPQQLDNGVRAFMLDTYDFKDDVWLCHSFKGKCHDYTAFRPALDTFKEIEAFLAANPSEILTVILEDYVHAPNGITKVLNAAGLNRYLLPVSQMPTRAGQDWPLVKDMVANNQRLVLFTSIESKQQSEGIAYQWNFMVENNYGNDGLEAKSCSNRAESAILDDKSKSLVVINHFRSVPVKEITCDVNSASLLDVIHTCYAAAGNRWANFVAVDFYKRGSGGGAFQAVDLLNGQLLCGRDDVHACVP